MKATDWDRYHGRPCAAAALTRSITRRVVQKLIKRHAPAPGGKLLIGELGGGNSCFLEGISRDIDPARYHVIDNNQLGLRRLQARTRGNDRVVLHHEDILALPLRLQLDVVFSVGLIEHFSRENTTKAVQAHFQVLKPEGIAIISFPTPTLLYRVARQVAEALGAWIFHDERPLSRAEVAAALHDHGDVLFEQTIWPIIFTQRIMVVAKRRPRGA